MNYRKGRSILVIIFFAGLILQLIFAFVCSFLGKIYTDTLQAMVLNLLQIYSVNIAVIFSVSYFNKVSGTKKVNTTGFIVALSLTLVWNLLLMVCIMMVMFGTYDATDAMAFQRQVAGNSNFLISGLIGYFFSKDEK